MEQRGLAKKFGVVIRRLRLQKGMSQEQFSDICGLHRTYVGSIERGEKTVTIETANKLAMSFGLTLVELFRLLEKESTRRNDVKSN